MTGLARAHLVALTLVCAVGAENARADETVRIAVGRFRDPFIVAGELVVLDATGKELARGARVGLRIAKGAMVIDGKPAKTDLVRIHSDGTLALAGHHYRHELEVQFRKYDGKPELLVVHPLDVETYVTGIVSAELPQGWPLAAYQAQAVAARTFAMWQKYRRLDLPYHMEASVLDQVYGGVEREHDLARQAAASTSGQVLTWKRHLAQAYFHASCGDKTESALEGWGTTLPYLPGSSCGACGAAGRHVWNAKIPRADVNKAFAGVLGAPVEHVSIAAKTKTGRVKSIDLEGGGKKKRVSGGDLRRLLGYTRVWSTWIEKLAFEGDALVVEGRGAGHGVGLCQWGARGRALAGDAYTDILARYYPGASLRRLY
jgi:stage II sporulation protein D